MVGIPHQPNRPLAPIPAWSTLSSSIFNVSSSSEVLPTKDKIGRKAIFLLTPQVEVSLSIQV